MRRNDPVGTMLLHALAANLEAEVGAGVGFAIFIDWRDGGLPSYASNMAPRRVVVDALVDWLARFDAALTVGAGDVVDLKNENAGQGGPHRARVRRGGLRRRPLRLRRRAGSLGVDDAARPRARTRLDRARRAALVRTLAMIAWLRLVVFPVLTLEEIVDECRRRRERR